MTCDRQASRREQAQASEVGDDVVEGASGCGVGCAIGCIAECVGGVLRIVGESF